MNREQTPTSLDRLPVGANAIVRSIGAEHLASLASEGVAPGIHLKIEAAAPFGGPVIIGLGRARVALARSVARTIEVAATEVGPELGPSGGERQAPVDRAQARGEA